MWRFPNSRITLEIINWLKNRPIRQLGERNEGNDIEG